ncbi:16S rRNA (guanine(527)-N(7))-methyltransferase RsmG [Dendrosporobacter sp. 1207_IL3150]|uniref:16S rRNA (guanine(527)-N(7))-methyltransferase RsmG n=1 Tax=Dendrosporobacter sp. 1207_IL3150 TaxID=3084054 RepID=UPI002FDA4437
MGFSEALEQAAVNYGISLTNDQINAYNSYFNLLIEWNEKINLTAITEPQDVAVKHIIDSLSCYSEEVFKPGAHIIDVGTGAGFPGLPLKIWQPNLKLTLLDSLNKRVNFLQTVVDILKIDNVKVIHNRAEEGANKREYREQYDVAVSRAVARLNVLCELCMPFVKVGGYFVALKGAQYQSEVSEAQRALEVLGGEIFKIQPVKLPGLDDVRAVVYIKKTKKTPKVYPRRPGTPEKKPL